MRRSVGKGLALTGGLALAFGAACGSEEAPRANEPSGRSMGASEASAEGEGNRAPRIEWVRIEPEDPAPGKALRARAEARDPDGDPVRLEYAWRLNGSLVREGRSATLETQTEKGDRIEVRAVASDGESESRPLTASARVRNRPPVLTGVYLSVEEEAGKPGRILAGPEATDPDGDELEFEYSWLVNGEEVEDAEGRIFEAEGLRRGDVVRVRVVATDGEDQSHAVTSREVNVGNSPPRIASVPEPRQENGTYRYDLEATDPDGDRRLRYRLAEAPEGMTVDPVLGVLSWTPDASQAGKHPVEVVVEDPHGASSALRFDLTVEAQEVEDAGGSAAPPAARAPEGG